MYSAIEFENVNIFWSFHFTLPTYRAHISVILSYHNIGYLTNVATSGVWCTRSYACIATAAGPRVKTE